MLPQPNAMSTSQKEANISTPTRKRFTSSVASATRRVVHSVDGVRLRHTQSMPVTRMDKKNISAPLMSTAVDIARGRFIRDTLGRHRDDSLPFAALTLPCASIEPQDGSDAREDKDTGIFEPRKSRRDTHRDLEKENIFEPRQVAVVKSQSSQSRRHVAFNTGGRASRPPRAQRNYVIDDPLHTLRALSPIREEDSTRRYGTCYSFATFEELADEVAGLECEEHEY